MTLGDRFDSFLNTYIRKSKMDEPNKEPEDNLGLRPDEYSEESKKFSMEVEGKQLNPELRRRMALTAPYYMKGLRKKCRDSFRSGWEFTRIKDGKRPPDEELKVIKYFNENRCFNADKRNINIEHFYELMKQDAHVYGDGICLYL